VTLEVEHGRVDGANKKRIMEYCVEVGDATRQAFVRATENTVVPQKEASLKQTLAKEVQRLLDQLQSELDVYGTAAQRLHQRVAVRYFVPLPR
jgi:flagellar basal body-associated protein FliL